MYVIFPLEQLLDNNSAFKATSSTASPTQSGDTKRHTVEVLSPTPPVTQPNTLNTNTNETSATNTIPKRSKSASLKKSASKTSLTSITTPPSPSGNPFVESPVNTRPKYIPSTVSSQGVPPVPPKNLKRQISLRLSTNSSAAENSSTSNSSKSRVNSASFTLPRTPSGSLLARSPSFSRTPTSASPLPINSISFQQEPVADQISLDINSEPVVKNKRHSVVTPIPSESVKTIEVSDREPIQIQVKNSNKNTESQPVTRVPSLKKKEQVKSIAKDTEIELPVAVRGSYPKASEGEFSGSLSSGARKRNSIVKKESFNKPSITPIGGVPGLNSPFFGMMASEISHKNLVHPSLNEQIKTQNAVNFKLVKTVSDFTGQLSRLHERHADDLQNLVHTFRRKNSELRNERASCPIRAFDAWENLLQEVEVDSQVHGDMATTMARQVSRPLIEKTFYRKIQSRKVFTHRESFETVLSKTEDMLKKCWRDYSDAYQQHLRHQTQETLGAYLDAHNTYVQQLHTTNAMLYDYHNTSLPNLLEELDEIYLNVSSILAESLQRGSELINTKAAEKQRRSETLRSTCHSIDPYHDMGSLIKSMENSSLVQKPYLHRFVAPQGPPAVEAPNGEMIPQDTSGAPSFKNELVTASPAGLSVRSRYDSLSKEISDLQKQIIQLQESQDALIKVQQRSLDSQLFNKVNELQEDISMKKFDVRIAQMHLSAVKAQKELLASKEGENSEGRDRKMSSSNTGGMKSKWLKAFKSLKSPGGGQVSKDNDKKNGRDSSEGRSASALEGHHVFQEYTYKKITACDICHQILRGHSRQGLKCRMCRINVHAECQDRAPKCQPKSRLLRRQRSTSELESKVIEAAEEDNESGGGFTSLIASQPGRRTMGDHNMSCGPVHPITSGQAIKSL